MTIVVSVADFQAKTGLMVRDTGVLPGMLDSADVITRQTPCGVENVSYADAISAYEAVQRSAAKGPAHQLTSQFAAVAKAIAFSDAKDVDWFEQTRQLAFAGAEHLTSLGLASDIVSNARVATKREELVTALSSAAFDGTGANFFWHKRCQETAANVSDAAYQLVAAMGKAPAARQVAHGTVLDVAVPDRAAIEARVSDYVALAQKHAFTLSDGCADEWKKLTRRLAFDTIAFTSDIAALVGVGASAEARAIIRELTTGSRAAAFTSTQDASTEWTRCTKLCVSNSDLARELQLALS